MVASGGGGVDRRGHCPSAFPASGSWLMGILLLSSLSPGVGTVLGSHAFGAFTSPWRLHHRNSRFRAPWLIARSQAALHCDNSQLPMRSRSTLEPLLKASSFCYSQPPALPVRASSSVHSSGRQQTSREAQEWAVGGFWEYRQYPCMSLPGSLCLSTHFGLSRASSVSPAAFLQTLYHYLCRLAAWHKNCRLSASGAREKNLVVLSALLISELIGRELFSFLDHQTFPDESSQALAGDRGEFPQGFSRLLVYPDRYYGMALFVSSSRWGFMPTLYHIVYSTCCDTVYPMVYYRALALGFSGFWGSLEYTLL